MTAANFTSRRADTIEVGDVVHCQGTHTVAHVTTAGTTVTVTTNDVAVPMILFPSQALVNTERRPS